MWNLIPDCCLLKEFSCVYNMSYCLQQHCHPHQLPHIMYYLDSHLVRVGIWNSLSHYDKVRTSKLSINISTSEIERILFLSVTVTIFLFSIHNTLITVYRKGFRWSNIVINYLPLIVILRAVPLSLYKMT